MGPTANRTDRPAWTQPCPEWDALSRPGLARPRTRFPGCLAAPSGTRRLFALASRLPLGDLRILDVPQWRLGIRSLHRGDMGRHLHVEVHRQSWNFLIDHIHELHGQLAP